MSFAASCIGDCCSRIYRDSPCCKEMPSRLPAYLLLAVDITLLVIGILGTQSLISITPAAAYCCILLSSMLFLLTGIAWSSERNKM